MEEKQAVMRGEMSKRSRGELQRGLRQEIYCLVHDSLGIELRTLVDREWRCAGPDWQKPREAVSAAGDGMYLVLGRTPL